MTLALTWSTLTKSTVNRSTARSAGSAVSGVHQSASHERMTCGPRVSGLVKEKEKGKKGRLCLRAQKMSGRLGGPRSRLGSIRSAARCFGLASGSGSTGRLKVPMARLQRIGPAQVNGPLLLFFSFPSLHGLSWAGAARERVAVCATGCVPGGTERRQSDGEVRRQSGVPVMVRLLLAATAAETAAGAKAK